jgi:hypothetical protein
MVYALRKFRHFFVGKQIYFLCIPRGFGILGQQTIGVCKDNQMAIVIFGA